MKTDDNERGPAEGDATLAQESVETYTVVQQTSEAQDAQLSAAEDILERSHPKPADYESALKTLEAILAGASPDDAEALKSALMQWQRFETKLPVSPDDELVEDWRTAVYPYRNRLSRKSYERQKYHLQVELLKLQAWVKETGQRVVILFEGRDAAGKGGTIKRFMEHLNPRGARVVALEKPTAEELGQWYFQRYMKHLPTSGEIVLFDRSWYNRAGVERVMGFCTDAAYATFMHQAPEIERHLVNSGIHLIKLWFSVSREEQRRRFKERETAPASSSGSSARSIWPRSTSGTSTPRPRRPCSSTPTTPNAPGSSSSPTARSGRASTPCATC
jgi:polyphosphate kinase